MDRFTRNYSIGLGAVVAVALVTWLVASWDPGAARLNALLEDDPQLATYPYAFRVVSLDGGVATMTSPRSYEVPVILFLGVLDPGLSSKPQDHPDVMAAQARLARHQQRAQALVSAQPDVQSVRWTLDRAWYRERGVVLGSH